MSFHPTAVIAKGARIGVGTMVGPYSVIGENVELGKDNEVGSHVVIEGHTVLGDGNRISQFASIGAPPQDLKFSGEPSRLVIGDKNVIREYVTLQPGTKHGEMLTTIGSHNLFMACSHVAHDCVVGSHNVFANAALLAGHVHVEDCVILGGLSGIHQFARIGSYAFIGAGAMVTKDVPVFCMAQGDRAHLIGINKTGLLRQGFSREEVATLRKIYRELFWGDGKLVDRIKSLRTKYQESKACMLLLNFISSSHRGISSVRKKLREDVEED